MKRLIFLLALLFGGFVFRGICCGIDWQIPQNHFDGVNEWGQLSYWTSIGDLDLGDEQKSPIIIGFNPTRKSGSAYLGSGGWLLPILESHIEQTSENAFTLVQPDGRLRFFGRDRVTNDTLSGQGGWKGEINGDKISLWAECGWRMTFFKGKINSIETPKGREFDYQYQDGLVSGLTEKGAPILVVERDPSTGKVNGLTSGGKHVGIEIGQKPQVQNVQGINLVVGLDYSLTKLTFPDGKDDTFTYGVDPALNPTLVIAGKDKRSFTWNPQTGVPLRDGDWTYQITLRKGNNPLFERTNLQNQKEIWDVDVVKGQETIQTLNGEKTLRTWFTSGILAGKPRKTEKATPDGVVKVLCQYAYNDSGALMREIDADGNQFIFDKGLLAKQAEAQRDAILEKLKAAKDENVKLDLLYELGLLYANQLGDGQGARELLAQMTDRKLKFNVELQSYDHDLSLSPQDKIRAYQLLEQKYPEQEKILKELIQIRSTES